MQGFALSFFIIQPLLQCICLYWACTGLRVSPVWQTRPLVSWYLMGTADSHQVFVQLATFLSWQMAWNITVGWVHRVICGINKGTMTVSQDNMFSCQVIKYRWCIISSHRKGGTDHLKHYFPNILLSVCTEKTECLRKIMTALLQCWQALCFLMDVCLQHVKWTNEYVWL